jgi:hypothetical protein
MQVHGRTHTHTHAHTHPYINAQVRYNRKRLKGGKGNEDCMYALTSLCSVLINVCKVRNTGGVRNMRHRMSNKES